MLNFQLYREAMVFYYDQISQNGYDFDAHKFARFYDAAYAKEGSWLRDLAVPIQEFARNRCAIELASGHGRWTRFIAESAQFVLATDTSAAMLDQARQVVACGRDIPPDRCEFRQVDAYHLD